MHSIIATKNSTSTSNPDIIPIAHRYLLLDRSQLDLSTWTVEDVVVTAGKVQLQELSMAHARLTAIVQERSRVILHLTACMCTS